MIIQLIRAVYVTSILHIAGDLSEQVFFYQPHVCFIFYSQRRDNKCYRDDGTNTSVTELENAGEHMDIVVSGEDERVITSTKPVMVTSFSSQEIGNSSMYVCDASLLLVNSSRTDDEEVLLDSGRASTCRYLGGG